MSTTVEEVMAPVTIVIGPRATVARARRIMKLEKVHALPVVDTFNAPLGVITSTDLMTGHPPGRRVSRVMTPGLITIGRNASVAAAARSMRKNRVHHLVVVQAGRVVGITSALDLLRLLEGPSPATARSRVKKKK